MGERVSLRRARSALAQLALSEKLTTHSPSLSACTRLPALARGRPTEHIRSACGVLKAHSSRLARRALCAKRSEKGRRWRQWVVPGVMTGSAWRKPVRHPAAYRSALGSSPTRRPFGKAKRSRGSAPVPFRGIRATASKRSQSSKIGKQVASGVRYVQSSCECLPLRDDQHEPRTAARLFRGQRLPERQTADAVERGARSRPEVLAHSARSGEGEPMMYGRR